MIYFIHRLINWLLDWLILFNYSLINWLIYYLYDLPPSSVSSCEEDGEGGDLFRHAPDPLPAYPSFRELLLSFRLLPESFLEPVVGSFLQVDPPGILSVLVMAVGIEISVFIRIIHPSWKIILFIQFLKNLYPESTNKKVLNITTGSVLVYDFWTPPLPPPSY